MTAPLTVVYRPIADLAGYAGNARTHSPEQVAQIAASIREFGFTSPLLLDDRGELIAGHGRLAAAALVGLESLPTITLSGLSPSQVRALRLADNQLALNAGWSSELLLAEIGQLRAEEYDLDLIGFDPVWLAELEGVGDPPPPDPGADDAPEVQAGPPDSKQGEVYQLGPHRLMCGDSTKAADIALLMGGELADLLVTDPPYGVSYAGKNEFLTYNKGNRNQTAIENDDRSPEQMREFWTLALTLACGATKQGGSYYVTGPQGGDLLLLLLQSLVQSGWLLKHMLIWQKNNHVLGRCDFNYKHEPILYGWKPGAGHYFDAAPGGCFSLWPIDRPHRSEEHPTMKPVALFAKAVSHGTRKGEVVLDPFLGSGTTLIACAETGRVCRGMELSPNYADVIRRRWTKWARDHGQDPGPGALEPLAP